MRSPVCSMAYLYGQTTGTSQLINQYNPGLGAGSGLGGYGGGWDFDADMVGGSGGGGGSSRGSSSKNTAAQADRPDDAVDGEGCG